MWPLTALSGFPLFFAAALKGKGPAYSAYIDTLE
jgi:hypothetical protein